MSLPPNRHAGSTFVISVLIVAVLSVESSLAFLQSKAYVFPSLSLKDIEKDPMTGFYGTNHHHASSPTSLSATKSPTEFSVLDIATDALSNPSYPLHTKNPLPFENPEIYREKNPFYRSTKAGASKSETTTTTGSKSTFKSQLNGYQPFWMKTEAKPEVPTTATAAADTSTRQTQTIDPSSHNVMMSSETSFPFSTMPTPKVSKKTFAIPKPDAVLMSFNGSTNRPSEETSSIDSGLSKNNPPKHSEMPRASLSPPSEMSKNFSKSPSNSASLPFKGTNNVHVASAAGDKGINEIQCKYNDPKTDTNNNKDPPRTNGTREIKKQWHSEIPSAVASTGAKVVETLAKAYAHPSATELLPSETASAVAPASPSSGDSNNAYSIDWESRLKALEQAVTSLAQGNSSAETNVSVDIKDTSIAPQVPVASRTSSPLIVVRKGEKKNNDWNIIKKLRNQVEVLQDTLHDMQHYETKTIHWSIPRIDKHLRLSSSTTFRSETFNVGSIPFHLEIKVQEASGEDDDQSVSFFLYHNHRDRYHSNPQSQYFLRPFQNERSRNKPIGSAAAPIHIGGSKLKIGEFEYAFGDSAFIQLGKQDGWGWQHLMSLKDLREYKCIKRGHLDMQFQVRMERENHDSSRVGVAMIS
ncbi:unnamed protein product [Cylindrotheca closterium]|uniref:Galectin n=1 Tax=Cylindrotheca closterium TaxID=2856 RepID=A0AAD2FXH9_9STRA|nr:unnamed protein product [Cylindrotheca closterium]